MKSFVVVGLGSFGSSAARMLGRLGHRVAAVDLDAGKVEHLAPEVALAVTGDATDPRVLLRLGAREADVGIVSTGGDVTASVLATLALRDCGVASLHVKVISELHARIMDKIGVTETIFPERDSGRGLARRLASRSIVQYQELAPGFSAAEVAVPRSWIGRSLRQLELPRRYLVAVIAVHDFLRDEIVQMPDPDAPLKDSDTLLVAGKEEHLAELTRLD